MTRHWFIVPQAMKTQMIISSVGYCGVEYYWFSEQHRKFKNGRQLSAWLGLTPSQHSSGDKSYLGKITKRGNRDLRRLLIQGARAVVNWCERKTAPLSRWLQTLKPKMNSGKLVVALANKLGRIIWAVVVKKTTYDPSLACKLA